MVIVVAVTNKEAKSPAHGISLFLIDENTPGFQKSWLMKKIGLQAFVRTLHCIQPNSNNDTFY